MEAFIVKELSLDDLTVENLALDQALLEIINKGPISEFEIVTKFKSAPYHFFNDQVMVDSLTLFQTHFVIFNALYRLRDIGLEHNQYDIDIISSRISYISFSSSPSLSGQKLDKQNTQVQASPNEQQAIEKLRSYYLDWDNFEQTTQANVNDLIDSFWKTMFSQSSIQLSEGNLTKSLSILELDALPTKASLKRQYIKLCNTHHPDKGGNNQIFQNINLAYNYIKKHV